MNSIAGNGYLKNCWCKRVNKAFFFFIVCLSLGIVLCMAAPDTKLTVSLISAELVFSLCVRLLHSSGVESIMKPILWIKA